MSTRYRIPVEIMLEAPILSQGVGSRRFGIDTAMQRDTRCRPALPGPLVRGNLREALESFAGIDGAPDQTTIDDWFGPPPPKSGRNDGDFEPRRARLNFSPWWSDTRWEESTAGSARHRISIDPVSGTVARGALQVIESPYPAGARPRFSGTVHLRSADPKEAREVAKWLQRGLAYTAAFGALKGIGFGRVLEVEVGEPQAAVTSPLEWPGAEEETVGLRMSLDRPFCIARPAVGENNRFDSETFIPGGAIIGSIANRCAANPGRWPAIERHLSNLQCHHALAVERGAKRRPLSPPLTVATVDGKLYDVATCSGSGLIGGKAPAFSPDWKDAEWETATTFCGAVDPPRRLDVRTAIDRESGTAAEQRLFSMESVIPDHHHWLSRLDLGRVPDEERAAVRDALQELLADGLEGIGKTKAHAAVTLEPSPALHLDEYPPLHDGLAVVTLLTPARLLPSDLSLPASNGGEALEAAYRESWERLSEGSLELKRFFARQRLQGGRYWWGRFGRRRHDPAAPYVPDILTAEGAVFVLAPVAGREEAAEKHLRQWRRFGLPQLEMQLEDWQCNPAIATNGYGEIAVNLKLHWERAPGEEQWHGL
ncbi:RAMP superfamily CRISPR-associated protein [Endothiovibrio diazotrophicus]